jgi:hypothetical protein
MKNVDGDLAYENKQNKMKLAAANNQIVVWKDRYYKVDKAEALVKYWQAQNYSRCSHYSPCAQTHVPISHNSILNRTKPHAKLLQSLDPNK